MPWLNPVTPPPIKTPASASDFCAVAIGPAQSCAAAGQAKGARAATITEAAKLISRASFTSQYFVTCVAPEFGGTILPLVTSRLRLALFSRGRPACRGLDQRATGRKSKAAVGLNLADASPA